ncbi:Hypothetical protein PHPALM_2397 [Phytophthora palmivora]|uniref:Uncharacterized protein n=1 Tax=Phytophthora palmivora TaxID=4796 RepID=A0A2P4YPV5_9STRA|nr:Hypothetical protein PHPALM_2397 [Phytophthora palmivora]
MVRVLKRPFSILSHIGQAESGNHCNVLLALYKLRISVLDVTSPTMDSRNVSSDPLFHVESFPSLLRLIFLNPSHDMSTTFL